MKNEWGTAQNVICPNCTTPNKGYANKENLIKVICIGCGSKIVEKKMGRKHKRLDVYAPEKT